MGRFDSSTRSGGAETRARVSGPHGRCGACGGRGRRRRDRAGRMTRIVGLTGATLPTAPSVCHECVFWQSPRGRNLDKRRWIRGHRGGVGRLGHGLLRRRRARARLDAVRAGGALPARGGAAGGAAVRRRGARHVRVPRRPVEAVGDAVVLPDRDRRSARTRARALEAFSYRYNESDSTFERFLVHKTIFPRLSADFGFQTVRVEGRVELARLELGGLVPVVEGHASGCCASCVRPSCRHRPRSAPGSN